MHNFLKFRGFRATAGSSAEKPGRLCIMSTDKTIVLEDMASHDIRNTTDAVPHLLRHFLLSKYLVKLFRLKTEPNASELQFYESIGLHLGESGFCIVVINVSDAVPPEEAPPRSNADLCHDVAVLAEKIMRKYYVCYCTEIDDKVALLICNLYSDEEYAAYYRSSIAQHCAEILAVANSSAKIRCSILVGDTIRTIMDISTSFQRICHEIDYLLFFQRLTTGVCFTGDNPLLNHYQMWTTILSSSQHYVDAILQHNAERALNCMDRLVAFLSSFRPLSVPQLMNHIHCFYDCVTHTFLERNIFTPDVIFQINYSQLLYKSRNLTELNETNRRIAAFFITNNVKYKSEAVQTRTLEIRKYIKQHITDYNLSVSQVAHLYDISPALLSSQFKKAFGQSPTSFIEHERIEVAKTYLTQTPISLKSICDSIGIGSVSTLNRIFKAHTGQSPSQFRKKARLSAEFDFTQV